MRDDEVFRAAIARVGRRRARAAASSSGRREHGYLRLNFSNQSVSNIGVGIARLAQTLHTLGEAQAPGPRVDGMEGGGKATGGSIATGSGRALHGGGVSFLSTTTFQR